MSESIVLSYLSVNEEMLEKIIESKIIESKILGGIKIESKRI